MHTSHGPLSMNSPLPDDKPEAAQDGSSDLAADGRDSKDEASQPPLPALTDLSLEGGSDHLRENTILLKEKDPRAYLFYLAARQVSLENFALQFALDGGAGTGKSRIAEQIAKMNGAIYLDTGLLYRAVALGAYNEGILVDDLKELKEAQQRGTLHQLDESLKDKYQFLLRTAEAITLDFSHCAIDPDKILNSPVSERDEKSKPVLIPAIDATRRDSRFSQSLTSVLHAAEKRKGMPEMLDSLASGVAQLQEIRDILLPVQQEIGLSCVMAGRDVGIKVLPYAEVKIILTADTEVRAARRKAQRGSSDVTQEAQNISSRDTNDSGNMLSVDGALEAGYFLVDSTNSKELSALKSKNYPDRVFSIQELISEDIPFHFVVDSSDLTLEETIDTVNRIVSFKRDSLLDSDSE